MKTTQDQSVQSPANEANTRRAKERFKSRQPHRRPVLSYIRRIFQTFLDHTEELSASTHKNDDELCCPAMTEKQFKECLDALCQIAIITGSLKEYFGKWINSPGETPKRWFLVDSAAWGIGTALTTMLDCISDCLDEGSKTKEEGVRRRLADLRRGIEQQGL